MHEPGTPHPSRGRRPLRWRTLFAWAVLVWLATGVYVVRTNERGVVRRCGKALPSLRPPGLHIGLPYGFDSVTRLRMLERKRVVIGTGAMARALGRSPDPRQAECVTGDRNVILAPAAVQYEIVDPHAYLFHVADVPSLVSDVTQGVIGTIISRMAIDDVLTVERSAIQGEVLRTAQAILDRYGAGVRLTAVSLDGAAPPREVADAFRDVTRAREDRQRAVNEAKGYAGRLLPQARGEAERIRLEAAGRSQEVVEKARGEAASFLRMAAELPGSRELTFKRLILETLERVLPRIRKIVLDEGEAAALDLGILEAEE